MRIGKAREALGVKSLFAGTPAAALARLGDGTPTITLQSEPTKEYGVGLAAMYSGRTCFSLPPNDQHVIWLQHSPHVPVVTRLAGKRTDDLPGPRTFIMHPAESDSTVETSGFSQGVLLRVSAECVALGASQLASHGSAVVETTTGYDEALYRFGLVLEAEAAAGHPNGMLFWSSTADALIRHLCAHYLSRPATRPRGGLSRDALKRLDAYIDANLAEPLDLDSLAAVVGCDRFHFAHRFRATAGVSPHRYVMRRRLAHACRHIRTGAGSLAQIAFETGFTDQSHLCRWARRVYNLRPKDLRN